VRGIIRYFEYEGERVTIPALSKRFGIPERTLRYRLNKMTIEEAIGEHVTRRETFARICCFIFYFFSHPAHGWAIGSAIDRYLEQRKVLR
jgi:hypothetical protein